MVRGHLMVTAMGRMLLFGSLLVFVAGAARAQSTTAGGMPPPSGMSLAQSRDMRFPQPIRLGDLIDREVIRPTESQDIVGHVRQIVRDRNGVIQVVIDFGGFLGFGSRPIAVPLDAMVLLGEDVEVAAFTQDQLEKFPTFSPGGTTPVAADTIAKVGLAKPSH